MTTIAFDGKFLAVDSQQTTGGHVTCTKVKKLFKCHSKVLGREVYMAAAGQVGVIRQMRHWLEHGGDVPTFDSDTLDGMVVDVNGENAAELVTGGVLMPIEGRWVGGSGYVVASTAMHLGLNAIDAVRTAIELDVYTGGDVIWVELGVP